MEVRKVNSVFFIKYVVVVRAKEQPQALYARADVSKVDSLLLLKDESALGE